MILFCLFTLYILNMGFFMLCNLLKWSLCAVFLSYIIFPSVIFASTGMYLYLHCPCVVCNDAFWNFTSTVFNVFWLCALVILANVLLVIQQYGTQDDAVAKMFCPELLFSPQFWFTTFFCGCCSPFSWYGTLLYYRNCLFATHGYVPTLGSALLLLMCLGTIAFLLQFWVW